MRWLTENFPRRLGELPPPTETPTKTPPEQFCKIPRKSTNQISYISTLPINTEENSLKKHPYQNPYRNPYQNP